MSIKLSLLLSLFSLPLFNSAQQILRCPPIDATGQGTQKIDVTLGGGPTFLYGDIDYTSNVGFGIVAKGDYRLYKGLYAGLEVQTGQLKAHGNTDIRYRPWEPRYVVNRYWAGSLNLTVYPYRFFVSERELFNKPRVHQLLLNGLYVGIGVGGILNNYTEIERATTYQYEVDGALEEYSLTNENIVNGPHELVPVYDDITGEPLLDANGAQIYTKSYLTKTRSALLPIGNLGVAMPLNKYTTSGRGYFSLVLNTQFSLSNSDDLDGYDPRDAQGYRGANERNDMYNLTYLGIRYSF